MGAWPTGSETGFCVSRKQRPSGKRRPVTPYREQADRLTLITCWRGFVPDQPVLVQPGETIWTETEHLVVRATSGHARWYTGKQYR